jgi:hypothetical protein
MEASSLIALWDGATVPIPLYTHYPAAGGRTRRTLQVTPVLTQRVIAIETHATRKKYLVLTAALHRGKIVIRVLNAILLFNAFLDHDQMWRRVCYRGERSTI